MFVSTIFGFALLRINKQKWAELSEIVKVHWITSLTLRGAKEKLNLKRETQIVNVDYGNEYECKHNRRR